MPNVLDELIDQQEKDWRAGIRPASERQMDPNAGPGEITVAPMPQPLIQGNFGASGTGWAQNQWAENANPAQLRENLSLDILRSTAMQRRQAIEQADVMNPLQTRLAQARINATGAHQSFMEHQDAQTLEHTANFLNHMADQNAPAPNDPNYSRYVLGGLIQNPRFAHSAGGREILSELAKTHDTHMSVEDLRKQIPEGFSPSSIKIGPNGASMNIAPTGTDVGKELGSKYGLKVGDFENPAAIRVGDVERSGSFKGTDKGNFVSITRSNGKGNVIMPVSEFERLGGKFSEETEAARGAQPTSGGQVKHLGTYDPATGTFK